MRPDENDSSARTSPTSVKDELPARPQLRRLTTSGGSLLTQQTLTQKRKPPGSLTTLDAVRGTLSSKFLLAKIDDASSPVRLAIVFFAGLALIEAAAIVVGAPLPPTPFAYFFYVSLILRVRYASHHDALLTWPVDKTLLFICVFDRWVFRSKVNPGIVKRFISNLRAKAVHAASRAAIRNPVRAARLVRRGLQVARWLAWGMPLVQIFMGLKDHIGRYLKMRCQRKERRKRKAALKQMRAKLDEHTSREEAARCIQAAFRGRKARQHVDRQKRSAQLRARAAAHKLLRAVHRHRARLQATADQRPLLLRPDSVFITAWKFGVLAMVLLDVAQVLLAPAEHEKLSHSELFALVTFDSECTPRYVDGPRKFLVGPRTHVLAPLAAHCGSVNVLSTPLASALAQVVAMCLANLVSVVAVCDVIVEFFTGVVSPTTGILVPKSTADRYFTPPFSLCFNLLVNPALADANVVIGALAAASASNPYFLLRLVIALQPVVQHAEPFAAKYVRRFCRSRMALFGRSRVALFGRRPTEQADAMPTLLAARSAALFS